MKDAALYGAPRPKAADKKHMSTSSTLAFSSQLSSLIAASTSTDSASKSSSGRQRPAKKEDIFSRPNKGSKKRALKDLETDPDDVDFTQKHATSGGQLDDATWKRARRKMEEKARLYSAMKRGDLEDVDEKHMVDFDRKWAEAEERGGGGEDSEQDESDNDESDQELVDYVDELGRTRQGTKAQARREEMRHRTLAAEEPDRWTARPSMPSNLIFGDTIQTNAFNPDEPIAAQMAELASKRDKSATPPPDTHFDARAEVRTKGTGFYAFSGEKEERIKQMEALEKERAETEKRREETSQRKEQRRKEIEERRKAIKEKRAKGQADRFLDNLGMEWAEGDAAKGKEKALAGD